MFLVGIQLDITAPTQQCTVDGKGSGQAAAATVPTTVAGLKGEEHHFPIEEQPIQPCQPSGRDVVAQKGVCGAVRVACRSLCPAGLRRSGCDQLPLRRSADLMRRSSEVSRVPPMSPHGPPIPETSD